jgi:hypothetical protein
MSVTERGDYAGSAVDEWGNRVFTATTEWGGSGTFGGATGGIPTIPLEEGLPFDLVREGLLLRWPP